MCGCQHKGAQYDNSSSIPSCRTPIRHLLLLSKRGESGFNPFIIEKQGISVLGNIHFQHLKRNCRRIFYKNTLSETSHYFFLSRNFLMAYAPPAAASKPSPPSMGACVGLFGGGGGWAKTGSVNTTNKTTTRSRLMRRNISFCLFNIVGSIYLINVNFLLSTTDPAWRRYT